MAVFGLAFFGVGGFMGWLSLSTLSEAKAMQGWDEVPAHIVECSLYTSKDSKGNATCKVFATYRYTVAGREYTGQRVGLSSGSDNIGSFHQRAYATLNDAKKSGATVPCRVDPANPDKAILFWEPRLELLMFLQIFVFAFGLVGLTTLCWALCGWRSRAPEHGRILMENTHIHTPLAVAATAIGLYALALIRLATQTTVFPSWGYALFAPTAIMALVALYFWKRFKKFGVSVLELTPCPAVAGQTARGMVHIPCRLEGEVVATLRYVHQYTTGSGKRARTHGDDVWKETKTVPVYVVGESMSAVKVEWEIARDYASTARRNHNGHWWELTLAAKIPGINYKAIFDVPVKRA